MPVNRLLAGWLRLDRMGTIVGDRVLDRLITLLLGLATRKAPNPVFAIKLRYNKSHCSD
jgi:hypothetical protein